MIRESSTHAPLIDSGPTITCRRSALGESLDFEPEQLWTLADIEAFTAAVRAHGGSDDLVIPGDLSVRLSVD